MPPLALTHASLSKKIALDEIRPAIGDAIFLSRHTFRWYQHPIAIIQANSVGEVLPALETVQHHIASGNHAAGFLAYEAAPAFDPALVTHAPTNAPLAWFGIYEDFAEGSITYSESNDAAWNFEPWIPNITREDYDNALRRIREYIAAGDTYQVNFTFPMNSTSHGDAWACFQSLARDQQGDHAAYIDTGTRKILSISPELFFRLDGDHITCSPMKGTAARGYYAEDDAARAQALHDSPKDRAENLMIVDMVRNDLGRIARIGSVNVPSLFDTERYGQVWQMTSTVTARTNSDVPQILRALFPCASITGAPKIRTMQIIRELELAPRGVYCGAIGWWGPKHQAEFNVAIRTVTIDSVTNHARYNVGGGITWDSIADHEYAECALKAVLLTRPRPTFELLESILWDGATYFLLDEHLERMQESAEYSGFPFNESEIRSKLRAVASGQPQKLRLLLARSGAISIASETPGSNSTMRVALVPRPIAIDHPFVYHKTTHRDHYDQLRGTRPDCDDVIFWNDRNEITESTIANVVVELDGQKLTPPIACGLLPGVMRRHLLERGEIVERVITVEDLKRAERIWLINSVRKWIPAILVP